ncbi:MAG TPA: AMP-binding protein, partial [Polyangiaceae bacterium]
MSFSIEDAAREHPARIALVDADRALSYLDLAAKVRAARSELRPLVDPSRPLALRARPRLGTIFAVLALLEDRIPFVPIHPRLTEAEASVLVADANASRVIDDDVFAALEAAAPIADPLEKWPYPSDVLATLFTSGTTGKARGAVLPRASFAASAEASAANLPWKDDDRWLLCMPLGHVGGLSIVTRTLAARRTVVFQSRFDVDAVLGAIGTQKVTRISVVPTMLYDLLERDTENRLASLETVLVGGAATSPSLLEECARRKVRALTTYGLTEACSQVATQAPRDPAYVLLGSGDALPGATIEIARADGTLAAAGEIGSISVRGPMLMRGYLGHAPLADGRFDTGDMGVLDERGALHVVARRTDLVVTGGENVYPLEVEAALAACTGVAGAVV